jgi:FMN reductase
MKITVLVGNPKADSRTLHVARAVAAVWTKPTPTQGQDQDQDDPFIVDLAQVAGELFDFESSSMRELLSAVAHSDLLVVASPTYKATYTGLLKVFLDRYGNDGLAGTVGVAVMTGAAPVHALAPEVHLRPLLVELGASVPARGLYVTESQFGDLDTVIASWAVRAKPLIDRALAA